MTYPHIDPDFDYETRKQAEVEARMAEDRKVFDAANAVMEAQLSCPFKSSNPDCFQCGNENCFKAFRALCELQGETIEQAKEASEIQARKNRWAVLGQTKRFEVLASKYQIKKEKAA